MCRYVKKDIYKIGFADNLERMKQFNNTHDYIVNCWKRYMRRR